MGRRPSRPELWPGASSLRFEDDRIARRLVAAQGAMSLEAIGECLGMTRQGVAWALRLAIKRALEAAYELGCAKELLELLEARAELAREPWPW